MVDNNAAFFTQNRKRITQKLKGGVLVLSAYTSLQRMNDMAFPFEQEANFWYLSGIEAPDWLLIIDGKTDKSWLVAPEVEAVHVLFDGELDKDQAKRISGVEDILTHDEGMAMLRTLARQHSIVYTLDQSADNKYYNFSPNPALGQIKQVLERIFTTVHSADKELAGLRAIKQPVEIAAIKKAIKLTNQAFEIVKEKIDHYHYEYEIEAEFSYWFRLHGAAGHAYNPIIASGANACTLHYDLNQSKLKKNQLILMDVGARVDGYAADITRTYSYGSASKRQVEVSHAVQAAQKEIIGLLVPGLPVAEYISGVDQIMQQKLIELGLLRDRNDERYRLYFPHAVSHGLGIDVHDSLGRPRVFEDGMVVTVEPGIYISEERIGIRIEDDILITGSGRKNLSDSLSTQLS